MAADAACCYICLEADANVLLNVCRCRDRAVHTSCLAQWVKESRSRKCPVCLSEYVPAAVPSPPADDPVPPASERARAVVWVLFACACLGFGAVLFHHGARALRVGCIECIAVVIALTVVYVGLAAATCDCLLHQPAIAVHPMVASTVDPAWPL